MQSYSWDNQTHNKQMQLVNSGKFDPWGTVQMNDVWQYGPIVYVQKRICLREWSTQNSRNFNIQMDHPI